MELVERRNALSILDGLRAAAFAGRGAVALVCGPVAVGKSALLDVFAGQVAEHGGLALTAVADPAERSLRLGVLGQFAHSAALPAGARADIRDLLARGSRAADGPDMAVIDELCAYLIDLSVRTPLAVVVDDAQHADPESLAGLGFLIRRIRDARIVVVAAYGAWSGQPGHDFPAEVRRRPCCEPIQLEPLSPRGVQTMLARDLGADAGARHAAAVHAASGGNPLIIKGLIEDFDGFGGEGPVLPVGEHYRRAVLAVLRRLGPAALTTAAVVAAGGDVGDPDRILGPAAVPVAELENAGVLAGAGFRHPAAAEAVLAAVDPAVLSRLGFQLAGLAHADGRPATAVADHLMAADAAARAAGTRAPQRDPAPWAASTLAEAARAALSAGRVGAGIGYLRLACRECADATERAALTTELVRAEWRRDPAAPMPMLGELVEAMRTGHLSGTDAAVLVRTLLWHGRTGDAETVLNLLARSAALDDPEAAAELRITRAWLRSSFAGMLDHLPDPDTGAASAPVGIEARRRLAAASVLNNTLTRGPSDCVVGEAERVLRTARLEDVGMDAVESALLALVYAEQPQRAAPWCDKLIAEASAGQAPGRQARLTAVRAEIRLRRGDFPGAVRDARSALAVMPRAGWGVALGGCLGTLLTALDAMGRHEEAVEVLHGPVSATMLDSRFGLAYLRARGRVEYSAADYAGALADFRYCGELMTRWSMDAPNLIPWRVDAAEAHVALGQPGPARELLDEHMARCAGGTQPRARAGGLRVRARLKEARERVPLLREAADLYQSCDDGYGLALALADLTIALSELGETRRMRVVGARALRAAAACEAEPLRARLSAACGPLEPEDADENWALGQDELSQAERRVADLAVLGLSNREISERLFITVSTVEQHLTKVYRKVGVTRRADLAVARSAILRTSLQT